MKRLVIAFSFIVPSVMMALSLSDGNYLIPVDCITGLPQYFDLKAITQVEHFEYVDGVLINGYYILNRYDEVRNPPLIYSARDLVYGNDGYCYISRGYDDKIEPLLLLFGGDTIVPIGKNIYSKPKETFLNRNIRWGWDYFAVPKLGESWLDYKMEYSDSAYREFPHGPWDDGIQEIKAWSSLTETVNGVPITYHANRMRFPFYRFLDTYLNFNIASLFWAEGEPGPGIGGTIDVKFKRKTDHVMVLNGAVDLGRLSIYKDNNRLKRVRVEGDDGLFSIEFTFPDHVQFHKIPFPKEASKIKITILEVYKGRKWDDTCVTKIFLKQPPLRPREEYDRLIEEYVRVKGLDALIEKYETEDLKKR